jgi:murein DD-endopeptidase MepM/ murein hydrolase activator NlpD
MAEMFGLRSLSQFTRDVGVVLSHLPRGERYRVGISTAGLFRPELSLPAYAGLIPQDGLSAIFNLFDRTGGGRFYRAAVTRDSCRDFRGGRLTYDEHDGTDFVCPPGTPLTAAAPGVVVATRDQFLRGGLTACVDHGHGVITHYTHLSRMVAEVGEPLCRGDVVGESGAAGLDLLSGFPWVPPHVHFMVWVRGQPVDPYLAAGEAPRPGTWLHGNDPGPSGRLLEDDPPPRLADIAVERAALERAILACRSPSIQAEIARASSAPRQIAIVEDSLHHDRDAWPEGLDPGALRPPSDPARVRLTLPLPASLYRGARAVDAPWTRPG